MTTTTFSITIVPIRRVHIWSVSSLKVAVAVVVVVLFQFFFTSILHIDHHAAHTGDRDREEIRCEDRKRHHQVDGRRSSGRRRFGMVRRNGCSGERGCGRWKKCTPLETEEESEQRWRSESRRSRACHQRSEANAERG